ncbi:hypothetical protein EYF80_052729 [Liparis tanakae]|uniref:Uncharacterized protein n=1 Tax=Liparis tanakae TaxID=230148 RepID=A0A4Z2F7X3_9TELE|nr:hypothetical protein EYF80_052729 [Liparis tanakae]
MRDAPRGPRGPLALSDPPLSLSLRRQLQLDYPVKRAHEPVGYGRVMATPLAAALHRLPTAKPGGAYEDRLLDKRFVQQCQVVKMVS